MQNLKHTPEQRKVTCVYGNKRKTWCGPYAVAVVTGLQYEDTYKALKKIRGKRSTAGVTMKNMMTACSKFSVKTERTKLEKRKKLNNFLRDNLAANKVYIVEITRHVIVVDTRDCQTIDNQSLKWEDMYSTKHKNKLVRSFVEIKNPKFDPMHNNMDFRFTEQLAAQG